MSTQLSLSLSLVEFDRRSDLRERGVGFMRERERRVSSETPSTDGLFAPFGGAKSIVHQFAGSGDWSDDAINHP